MRGPLEIGDQDLLPVALQHPKAVVALQSDGGSIITAIEIGKAIRLKQYSTLVPSDLYCASACALIWLAGNERFMDATSRVGFHAAFDTSDGKVSSVANALVGAYLNQLGLGPAAIAYITQASPQSMQWLTAHDANAVGIDVSLLKQTSGSPALPPAMPPPLNWEVGNGVDLYGNDLPHMPINNLTLEECEGQCHSVEGCVAYTYNRKHSACFLKSSISTAYRNDRAISGYPSHLVASLKLSPFAMHENTDLRGGTSTV